MYVQSRQGQSKQGTNLRLNTGRIAPTGYSKSKPLGSHQPFLNLPERPITQQGLVGLKPMTAGPKRKVLSRSYFLVLLKQKVAELTGEIAGFREQGAQLSKEQEQSRALEQHHAALTAEVRELEGTLADYNLALDKQRTGTRPEDLLNVKDHIAFQNQKLRGQLDAVFMERKAAEEKTGAFEERIVELREGAELKLRELGPAEREEYRRLEASLREQQAALKLRLQNLEDLSRKILEQEGQLRADLPRMKMIQVKESSARFEEKRRELEEKLAENALSFEELRSRLMERVKTEKGEIQALEKRAKELRKLGDAVAKKLARLADELRGGGAEINEEQKRKFEVLYAREKELNAFLSAFEATRQKRADELQALEAANLRLAEAIARSMGAMRHAPSQKDLKELAQEVSFKRQQAENSEETLRRLQLEHLRRQEELQRVDEIEETLPERIKQFKGMVEAMKGEMGQLDRKDTDKRLLQQKSEFLTARIKGLEGCRDELVSQSELAQREYGERLVRLQGHAGFARFVELEKQLSQANQLAAGIENYIKAKENECDFGLQVAQIMEIAAEINGMLIA